MAMNKKEKAYLEKIEVIAAFRLNEKVIADVSLRREEGNVTSGFRYNCSSERVSEIHADDVKGSYYQPKGIDTLFSTKLLAFKAMRHDIAMQCALKLRRLDLIIEKEMEK